MIHPTPCLACISFSILTTIWLHFMACGAMTDPTTSETSPPAKDTWTSLNVLWELETIESKDCETMINTLPERILLLIRTFAHVEQASFQKDVRTVVSIVENLARLRNIRSSKFRTDLDMVVRTLQLAATDAGYPNQDNTAATAAKMSDSYPGLLPFDERIDAPPAADAYEPGFLDVYFQRMQAVVVLIRSRIIPLLFTRWIASSSWLDVTQLCVITLNSYSLVNWFIPFTRHKKRPFSLAEDRLSLTFDGSESWKYLIRALEVLVGEARDALNKSLSSLSGENAFQFYASPPALSDLEQFIESTKSVADKDDSFLQVLHFFLQWSAYYRSLFRTALRYRAQSLIRTLRGVENEHQQQKLESTLGDLQTMEHEVCVTKIHLKYLQKETPTTAPAPSSSARDVAYLAKVLSFFAFPLTFSRPTKPIESIDGNDPPKTPLDTDIHTQQLLLERQRVSLVLAILIAISGLIFFSLCTFMILIPSNIHSLTFQSDANEYKPEDELREINDEEHTHPAMPENFDRGFQFPENPRLLII